ncbi:MAG: substrate-binding domain-containing protein [Chloroflexi bacterium]|nr:substrate-binding domain-containing protein [Chloroflexota bacterium]
MRSILAGASIVALCVLAAGCGGPSSTGVSGGGASPNPPARSAGAPGKPLTIVMIPKSKGNAYFNACEKGADEAAASLPGVTLNFVGTTDAKSSDQIDLINSWIVRKPDVIAVSCNDPEELAPSLARARSKGIHVLTWDADADPKRSGREFFVNQASPEAIGTMLVDVMAKEAGPDAHTIVITSTLTSPNQSEWLSYMRKRMAQKYPKMQIRNVYPAGEDQNKAFVATQDALKAYPDVKGIWGITSVAFPGAADAVQQAHDAGKVVVTGLATPLPMKPFVDAGVVKTVVLWNPIDLGYLTVYAAKALADGTLKPGAASISAGRLGSKTVSGDQVLLGQPMLFTRKNIGQFNF